MVKLRKITLSGFRGARYPFSIDLGKSCRSIAIFGENGAGKSTITDAVEWWFKDRIEHLWREDCKEKSLRNIFIKDTDVALVRLDFSDETFSSEKRIASDLAISETNTDAKFEAFKAKVADERVVLRTSDLIDFLEKSKGDKRKDIGEIIGFESLADFRDLIQKGENDLKKDGEYTHAVRSQDEAKSKLMTISGSMPVREKELFQRASELVSSLKLITKINDAGSYQGALDELTKSITNKEGATKQLTLKQLSKTCESLIKALTTARSISQDFLKPYNVLVADKEKIKFLNVEKFLTQGRELLDEGLLEQGKCPFCNSTVDLEHVRKEVVLRIAQLEDLRKSFDKTLILRDKWIADLKEVNRLVVELEERCTGLALEPELPDRIDAVKKDVANLVLLIPEKYKEYQEIAVDERVDKNARALEEKLRARMDSASAEVAMLDLTTEEQSALSMIQTLKELRAAFDSYQLNAKIKESFERQIKTLAKIKESFIKLQAKSLQEVLDIMSDDIKRFYLALHPKENIDGVKLRMVGAEGVEFEYSFHGKETYPPKKYLSESHLNSLGVALFLSSAKLFNKECKFMVLDDIVTSFDSSHRLRLLRLLKEEFLEWQIVLLTHQRHWFEMIKRELGSSGWMIWQVDWSDENGVIPKASPVTLRELIAIKRSQGHDVSNDIRTLLEEVLKEICSSLHVKMSFRYNDENETRTAGDLLNDLRRTLKEKSSVLRNDPIFDQIDTANVLGTMGSHDRPKETSKADLDVALEDIDKLEKLFRCECGWLVSKERAIASEKRITCKCGKKSIPWAG